MKLIRFILFSCLFILCIVLANIIHKNIVSANRNTADSFVYSNFVSIANGDIKSLASISFSTSFEALSKLFENEKDAVRNRILRRDIRIRESDCKLIVFVGDNSIEQITVNTENNVETSLNNILNNLSSNNINLNGEIIDDTDGGILAEIYSYENDNYRFVITKSNLENNQILSVDFINLKVL